MDFDTHVSNSAITSVPAGSSTVILFDSTADPSSGTTLKRRRAFPQVKRAMVTILSDVAVTFFFDELAVGSSTWRTVNGSGSGEATTGNTWFQRDCLIESDDFRLKVVTTTGPATWEVTVRLSDQRAIGQ